MKTKLINCYRDHAVADSYIIGFIYQHRVYALKTTENVMMSYAKLDIASRGQGSNLRLRLTNLEKIELINMGAIPLGDESIFSDGKYNKGEKFEKIITEAYGQVWVKDRTPWWVDGDITVNGEKIQIKFEKASILTEKQIARFN